MAIKELNPNTPATCSLCGQPEADVKILIHSRGNYICNHCVEQINELLKNDEEKEAA